MEDNGRLILEVNGDLLTTAYACWRHLTRHAYNTNSRAVFLAFLGVSDGVKWKNHKFVVEMPEEAYRKIKWLTGPHAHTMYKIWEAQHESVSSSVGND